MGIETGLAQFFVQWGLFLTLFVSLVALISNLVKQRISARRYHFLILAILLLANIAWWIGVSQRDAFDPYFSQIALASLTSQAITIGYCCLLITQALSENVGSFDQ